jgi:hypothetical protein
MIFSYFIDDNPLFRIATYLFIGVSSAYVTILIIYQILLPKLILPILSGSREKLFYAIVPLILCILLLSKLSPRISRLGSVPMAFLVGIGAAVIITGSIFGTFFTQIGATTNYFSIGDSGVSKPLLGFYVLFGTICTLIYFQFSTKSKQNKINKNHSFIEILREFGKIFIGITLGSIFAGIILSALIALIERIQFIVNFITGIF